MEDKNPSRESLDPMIYDDFRKAIERIESTNTNQELYAKKQYHMSQITALASVIMLCAVVFTCSLMIPRMNTLFSNLEVVMTDIEVITEGLTEADLPGMITHVDSLVTSSEQNVLDALDKVNAIDIETLNKAIKDLSDIINPVARLFGKGK